MPSNKLSEEHKQKLRDSYYNNPKRQAMMQSEEYKQKISKAIKGKKFSQEHKNKIALGRKNWLSKNKHTIMGINNPFYGKKHSKESLEKMSKIKKGKKMSESFCINNKIINTKEKNPFYGKKHSDEVKSFLKEHRKYRIISYKDTKIEIKIQTFLSELQIPFLKHPYISQINHGYQCDILIPTLFMVIECDGNYWHNYPHRTEIDNIRTKELEEQAFRVVRLWESEIHKMNLQDFKNRIGVNI